jgi:hypothetical protein
MEIKATVQFYVSTEMETLNFKDVKCKAESFWQTSATQALP